MRIDAALAYLPDSLLHMLRCLVAGKFKDKKVASFGHAIAQAVHPRLLLSRLQLGLGVQMHHHFSSRFLIETLNSLGFCCSYTDVKNFERSAAMQQGTDLSGYDDNSQCVQYVADNADHNSRTLDGLGTFPGMWLSSYS